MPFAPPHPCREPQCPNLVGHEVDSGRCPEHQKLKYKRQDARRGSAAARGYDSDWHEVRILAFTRDAWRCVDCGWQPDLVTLYRDNQMGVPPTATVLEVLRIRQRRNERHLHGDHILPIEDRPDLRLDITNIATRCSVCHNRRTLRESVMAGSTA